MYCRREMCIRDSIGGRNRVDGLVGVGHGVKKRLHGALDEVDERFFDGELGRSAQHGVLEDVEDARVVCRWGFEADGKRLVLILAGKEKQACSGCSVIAVSYTHLLCGDHVLL